MQVIAPDFFAGAAGSASREAERPGNGRFESLLRDVDLRYRRDTRDLPRPAVDDLGRKDPPREKPLHDTRAREERVERRDRPAPPPASDRPASARRPQDDTRPAPATEGAAAASDPATAQAEATTAPAAAPAAAAEPTQPQANPPGVQTTAVTAPDPTTTPEALAVAVAGMATETAGKPTQPGTLPAAVAGAPASQPAAAQPSGEAGAATPETTAQPASGAAAALRAADKAAPQATNKTPNPVAAAHRQSPLDGPPAGDDRPQAGSAAAPAKSAPQVSGQAPVVTGIGAAAATTLESRPAAATLGGAAAAVALAQSNETQGSSAKAEPPSTLGQQNTAGKSAAQPGQTATTVELPTTAAAKAATERAPGNPPVTFSGGDPAATPGTPSTMAAGLAQGAGGVQGNSFAETLASARHAPAANPAEQIAIQVQRAQVAGQERISIKLHPAELGRIEVRLENASDGTLRAVISAERSETLDLLQRDARGLERALQEAGIKTDSGSLNFNLRGNGQGQNQLAEGNGGSGRSGAGDGRRANGGAEAVPDPAQTHASSHDGTLDIRV